MVNLSCAPPLCHFLLLRSLLFAWLSSSSLLLLPHPSLSLHPFLPSSSVSFYPYFLPNAITRRCYRAEHNYRSALYPRDMERGELTIRQFKSTILILTVTPIIIFHITLGRKDKKDYGSSPFPPPPSPPLFRITHRKWLLIHHHTISCCAVYHYIVRYSDVEHSTR